MVCAFGDPGQTIDRSALTSLLLPFRYLELGVPPGNTADWCKGLSGYWPLFIAIFRVDFAMSAGSTRRAHRNWRRNERRLQAYLHRCVICFGEDRTSPYPSSLLPCCRQFCHEHCLLRWLECSHTPGPVKSCPHCRAGLLPVNPHDRVPSVPDAHPFMFQYLPYPSRHDLVHSEHFSDHPTLSESESDRLFLSPPLPSPPPGWAAFRRAYPAFSNNFSWCAFSLVFFRFCAIHLSAVWILIQMSKRLFMLRWEHVGS